MKESEITTIYDTDILKCDTNPLKHTEIYQLKDSGMDDKNASAFEVKGGDEQRNHYRIFDEFSTNYKNGSMDAPRKEVQNGFLHNSCTWEIDDDEPLFSSFDYKKQDSKDPEHESLAVTEITDESKDLHFIMHNGSLDPFLDYSDHHQYTDKKVVECDNYHVVKDICVDMGMAENEKIIVDSVNVNNHDSTNPFLKPEEGKEDSCGLHAKGIDDLVFFTSDENTNSIIGGINECERIDQAMLSHQVSNEQEVSESSKASSVLERAFSEDDSKPDTNISDPTQLVHVSTRELETTTENVQEQNTLIITEEARNFKEIPSNDKQVPDDETQEKSYEGIKFVDHDQSPDQSRNSTSDDINSSSENQLVQNASDQNKSQLHHDELGETSFSAASLVAYSGPILAYSGSISHRSDASTTSGRSFAFPILQSEWNSSPVRMAKADRRHFRKHKGWRSGLLCCRFC